MPVPTMPPTPRPTRCSQPSVGFSALCELREATRSRLLRRFQNAMLGVRFIESLVVAGENISCRPAQCRRSPSREMAELPALLVVMALPLESQGVFERAGIDVLFTGIGKVNAAYALTRRLADYRHAGLAPPE